MVIKACDISLLNSRLKSILSSGTSSSPIYVDVPGVPSTTRSRFRLAQKVSNSVLDMLGPVATDYEQVASMLTGEKGRPIRSANTIVEALRIIKSDAEVKVMKKAADISSDAHAKVCFARDPSLKDVDQG